MGAAKCFRSRCDQPAVAHIITRTSKGELAAPVCVKHGQQSERSGKTVLWASDGRATQ